MAAAETQDVADLIPPLVLRNLGDRTYEKRKTAAMDIEQIVKDLNGHGLNRPVVRGVIQLLVKDFCYSTQANQRKGGLLGLAATALAAEGATTEFLPAMMAPVLRCFQDPESRVRYYACEALFNIVKVVRGQILTYFNEIFDGLCKLYADVSIDVKNGAQLLDRLVKDVVTECEVFDVDKFIPILRERILIRHASIRQLLIGWISVLHGVESIDVLQYLPEYLGGLFEMLSDANKDIRQQASRLLNDLLREVVRAERAGDRPMELGSIVRILVAKCDSQDNFTRLIALSWLASFVQLGTAKLRPMHAGVLGAALACISDSEKEIRNKAEQANEALLKLVHEDDQPLQLKPLLDQIGVYLTHPWVPSRLAALRWVSMLLGKLPGQLWPLMDAELFPLLMQTLQDPDEEVVRLDLEVLARISLNRSNQLDQDKFDLMLDRLVKMFRADRKFLELRGSLVVRQLGVLLNGESIFRALSGILEDEEPEFASLMVQTLNLILLTAPELFDLRRRLKNSRRGSALSTAAPSSSPSSSFSVARNAIQEEDEDSEEEGEDAEGLFLAIYRAWTHNAVASFSLCLMAQQYELAAALIFKCADVDITVGFLMQIDKLVQLIESPIFIHLRLQLLEPHRHPHLFKALYGLMMLLPQSNAFNLLQQRLSSVASLASFHMIPQGDANNALSSPDSASSPASAGGAASPPSAGKSRLGFGSRSSKKDKAAEQQQQQQVQQQQQQMQDGRKQNGELDFSRLLQMFEDTQARHTASRKRVFLQKSLIGQPAAFAAPAGPAEERKVQQKQ